MAKQSSGTSKGSIPPKNRPTIRQVVAQGPIMTEEDKEANKAFLKQFVFFKKMEEFYAPLKYKDTYYSSKVKEFIVGQDTGIDALVYIVYHNMHQNMMSDYHGFTPQRYSAVVVGPSGCGKTATLTKIAELFNVPFVKYNATPLTSGGFVGKDVENMLEMMLDAAGGDQELAERGILYIDEIDKKVRSATTNTSGRDVNGTAVQEELLKFLESSIIDLGHGRTFDISHLTILMSGRFVDIDKIKKKRVDGQYALGFGNRAPKIDESSEDYIDFYNEFDDSKSDLYTHQDIIDFGFLDEFVGRIYDVIEFKALTRENLMDIIFSKGSSLTKFVESIKSKGQELIIDPMVFERMVDAALKSPRGVRCLESIMNKFLVPADRDFMMNYRPGIMEYDEDGNYTSIFESPNEGKFIFNHVESERSKKLSEVRKKIYGDDYNESEPKLSRFASSQG